jgi:acyl carrier protein/NAD(P)-dependent dehydrogenase (short-subunit alcohol dehydrogenase family)
MLAEYLARTVQAKLTLPGRSAFPKRDNWETWLATHDAQDDVSRKIRKVQMLEELGAEVFVLSADVANQEHMQSVVTQIYERFGIIHGVIHAAGIVGGGMIQLKTPEKAASVFAPKVKGTLVLEAVLNNVPLDFLVLCSSTHSVTGRFGQVDYCAANAFLDAFAHYYSSRHGVCTVSINWDGWQDLGMAVDVMRTLRLLPSSSVPATRSSENSSPLPDELGGFSVHNKFIVDHLLDLEEGIWSTEGVDALHRVLASRHLLPHVVVSTRDLNALIEKTTTLKQPHLLAELEKLQSLWPTHPRPPVQNAYVAPCNEVQRTLAELWQEVLGIDQVGINDNFFALGGDSLLATQVVSRLRSTFQVELPLQSLFEAPTVAELVKYVETIQWASQGQQAPPGDPVSDYEEGEL